MAPKVNPLSELLAAAAGAMRLDGAGTAPNTNPPGAIKPLPLDDGVAPAAPAPKVKPPLEMLPLTAVAGAPKENPPALIPPLPPVEDAELLAPPLAAAACVVTAVVG